MAYSLGIDFGTQSGRVLLLNLDTGNEMAVSVVEYKHGVIDNTLPVDNIPLGQDWALQHPSDYIDVLLQGIPDVLGKAGVSANEVVGLGIDFTSCTVLPVKMDGTPLCMLKEFKSRPHAWPKLWKHHAAQPYADKINETAVKSKQSFISRYGDKASSEWYYPKLLEVFAEDREVYDSMFAFVEATDWIVWYLTGELKRNSCTAGYKAFWSPEKGVPPEEFFQEVQPGFSNPLEKLGEEFYALGSRAGTLRSDAAEQLGLNNDVAVAVGNVDAMVSAPSVGVSGPGSLVMVMGTSICHLAVSQDERLMPGITGVVKDGVIPGFYGYEAGQAAVGDMYAWFVKNAVPDEWVQQAAAANLSVYGYMEQLAEKLVPGQSGVVALDWWNGNRSTLSDADLTGVMVGLTLSTKPEEIYRALLESTAFGTRRIMDNFKAHQVEFTELVACGGLAQKSPLLMQVYADVCQLPVVVRDSQEIPARGSAMYGAVAAGSVKGGFDTIQKAVDALASPIYQVYEPNADIRTIYDSLYKIYTELYDWFGVEKADLLHDLKRIKKGSGFHPIIEQ